MLSAIKNNIKPIDMLMTKKVAKVIYLQPLKRVMILLSPFPRKGALNLTKEKNCP